MTTDDFTQNKPLHKSYELNSDLSENFIWKDFEELFDDVSKHIVNICYYGFTEMVNNAIDHSEGTVLDIFVAKATEGISIWVIDNGEGIFNKIKRILKLPDERLALLELSKGKLTTDPKNHTGQGIFFTSRAFDNFNIFSGNLIYSHDGMEGSHLQDWLIEHQFKNHGTAVIMNINFSHKKTLKELFDDYAFEEDDYDFSKTIVPIKLAKLGKEELISRSQGKRVVVRFEKFKQVILDFSEVDFIGQAFADQIFRVFQNEHPEVKLSYIHANEEVEKMIKRALHY